MMDLLIGWTMGIVGGIIGVGAILASLFLPPFSDHDPDDGVFFDEDELPAPVDAPVEVSTRS